MPARKSKPAPPDWLPNCRDPSAYPARRSNNQWRWQFLRRREDYQTDFAQHYPQTRAYYAAIFRDDPKSRHHVSSIAKMPDSRAKYGVGFLLDPSREFTPPGFFEVAVPFGVDFASREQFDDWEKAGIQLVAFDLTKPLMPQFARAKPGLEELQRELHGKPKSVRQHRAHWATYLRVLDAYARGMSASAIGRTLKLSGEANAEKRARDTLQQARLVSDGLTSPLKP